MKCRSCGGNPCASWCGADERIGEVNPMNDYRDVYEKFLTETTGVIGLRLDAAREQYLLDDLLELHDNEDGDNKGTWATFKEWDRRIGGPKNYISYADTLMAHARTGDK